MMGTQWTSKYAILRDLSYVQGRKVPAAIVDSVRVDQKPPAIRIQEDTEEQFFQNCVGDGDVCTEPDLNLISQMINMVHENDIANEDDDTEKVVEISKLNPLSKKFVPNNMGVGAKSKGITDKVVNEQCDINVADHCDIDTKVFNVKTKNDKRIQKKRSERNVALMSLLEKNQCPAQVSTENISISNSMNAKSKVISEVINNIHCSEIKLLRPNDFISDAVSTDKDNKVSEWLQRPNQPQAQNTKPIDISPTSMFKKRNLTVNLENTCMFKRKSDTSSVKSSDSDTMLRPSDNVFVPTTDANKYYEKFVERRKVQEVAQDDIWKRAETLMKEIDMKRLQEKKQKIRESIDSIVQLTVDLEGDANETENNLRASLPLNIPGLDTASIRVSILLTQHRHDLPEECKVCLAVAKYRRNLEREPPKQNSQELSSKNNV